MHAICKRHAMAFLDMSRPSRRGYILKEFSAGIPKHSVGDESGEIGIAGSTVEIQPPIVVEVTIIVPHRVTHPEQVGFDGDVLECPITVIAVKPRLLRFIGQAKVILRHLSNTTRKIIPEDQQVFPPIVIVIEEERPKTQNAVVDACEARLVAELPLAGGIGSVVM